MGHDLISQSTGRLSDTIPPWLDPASAALVRDIVATLVREYTDLLAVILYGSVARHDERPLDAPHPSDVDVLVVFDTNDELVTVHRGLAISQALGPAYGRHLDAPHDVRVMLASRSLREWDPTFIASVARDGVPLFIRDRLPEALARTTTI
jgi:predicted nucleotidyltransferase